MGIIIIDMFAGLPEGVPLVERDDSWHRCTKVNLKIPDINVL